MAKLKNPLFSFEARNTLAGAISFVRRRRQNIAEKKPVPEDVKSLAQLSWRHMYIKAVALWHALSAAEKQDWESQARSRHMTGFAWFISQALKPNPGLYLPLQGGTMTGDIDMAKYHILRLPAPVDAQEALRLSEYTANIAPYLYDEGARVYHDTHQAIPNNVLTTLAFNSERWDNDSIHDLLVNNSRLTCKTAGKYIIVFHGQWETSAVGVRRIIIDHSVDGYIAFIRVGINAAGYCNMVASTIGDFAVNDFVEVKVLQTSGAPLNFESWPKQSPEFMMQRIGT